MKKKIALMTSLLMIVSTINAQSYTSYRIQQITVVDSHSNRNVIEAEPKSGAIIITDKTVEIYNDNERILYAHISFGTYTDTDYECRFMVDNDQTGYMKNAYKMIIRKHDTWVMLAIEGADYMTFFMLPEWGYYRGLKK